MSWWEFDPRSEISMENIISNIAITTDSRSDLTSDSKNFTSIIKENNERNPNKKEIPYTELKKKLNHRGSDGYLICKEVFVSENMNTES